MPTAWATVLQMRPRPIPGHAVRYPLFDGEVWRATCRCHYWQTGELRGKQAVVR